MPISIVLSGNLYVTGVCWASQDLVNTHELLRRITIVNSSEIRSLAKPVLKCCIQQFRNLVQDVSAVAKLATEFTDRGQCYMREHLLRFDSLVVSFLSFYIGSEHQSIVNARLLQHETRSSGGQVITSNTNSSNTQQ